MKTPIDILTEKLENDRCLIRQNTLEMTNVKNAEFELNVTNVELQRSIKMVEDAIILLKGAK